MVINMEYMDRCWPTGVKCDLDKIQDDRWPPF